MDLGQAELAELVDDFVVAEGFADEAVGIGIPDMAVEEGSALPGDEDDAGVGVAGADFAEEFETVDVGHGDVGDNDVEGLLFHFEEGVGAIDGGFGVEAG